MRAEKGQTQNGTNRPHKRKNTRRSTDRKGNGCGCGRLPRSPHSFLFRARARYQSIKQTRATTPLFYAPGYRLVLVALLHVRTNSAVTIQIIIQDTHPRPTPQNPYTAPKVKTTSHSYTLHPSPPQNPTPTNVQPPLPQTRQPSLPLISINPSPITARARAWGRCSRRSRPAGWSPRPSAPTRPRSRAPAGGAPVVGLFVVYLLCYIYVGGLLLWICASLSAGVVKGG